MQAMVGNDGWKCLRCEWVQYGREPEPPFTDKPCGCCMDWECPRCGGAVACGDLDSLMGMKRSSEEQGVPSDVGLADCLAEINNALNYWYPLKSEASEDERNARHVRLFQFRDRLAKQLKDNARISGGAPCAEADCSALHGRIAELENGLRQIAVWNQADQDDHETCALQWRGCVAIARELLKPNVPVSGVESAAPRRSA